MRPDMFQGNTFQEEKLLYEQDPHMLEEQRYLDRLKLSQVKQHQNYDHLDKKFRIPAH